MKRTLFPIPSARRYYQSKLRGRPHPSGRARCEAGTYGAKQTPMAQVRGIFRCTITLDIHSK